MEGSCFTFTLISTVSNNVPFEMMRHKMQHTTAFRETVTSISKLDRDCLRT